jgi:hypothetical protein
MIGIGRGSRPPTAESALGSQEFVGGWAPGGFSEPGPDGVADREPENDQSRLASREAGCALLREVRRVMRLVISVIAAHVIKDSECWMSRS